MHKLVGIPRLRPHHGTVSLQFMGNCGVSFAPVRTEDKELLAEMMESVEDIPRHAIYRDYPGSGRRSASIWTPLSYANAVNVAALVGHAATRFYVMGPRAVEEAPTAEDISQIAELAGKSVREGAAGFSVNRLKAHRLPDGRCIQALLRRRMSS